jgi:hypothetical protein
LQLSVSQVEHSQSDNASVSAPSRKLLVDSQDAGLQVPYPNSTPPALYFTVKHFAL